VCRCRRPSQVERGGAEVLLVSATLTIATQDADTDVGDLL
jgi:hypothetical protein